MASSIYSLSYDAIALSFLIVFLVDVISSLVDVSTTGRIGTITQERERERER